MSYKILTLNAIATQGLKQFPENLYKISNETSEPDGILVRSQSLHEMPIPKNLKAIGRAGAGVNNIPVEKFTQIGIPVFNTPGANANAVKELVLLGMLLASRNIFPAWDYVKQLKGDNHTIDQLVEKNKKQFLGSEIFGKTLGIIGLGHVGVKVANTALSLGMNVIGYDPSITVKRAWELSAQVVQAESLESLLKQADFISLHVPLMDETRHLINAQRLQLMQKNTVLLNFARDAIVDEAALLQSLNENQLGAYVCDFPSENIIHHPKIISLPHLGASTKEAEENCAVMAVKQLRAYLEQGNIHNSVNFPEIAMPPTPGFRLAIANSNIPNMVAQISSHLGNAGLNILDLLNKSRGEIAYTLVDTDSDISDEILKKIATVPGILQIRKIGQIKSQIHYEF